MARKELPTDEQIRTWLLKEIAIDRVVDPFELAHRRQILLTFTQQEWRKLHRIVWDEMARCLARDHLALYSTNIRYSARYPVVRFLKEQWPLAREITNMSLLHDITQICLISGRERVPFGDSKPRRTSCETT